MSDQSVPLEVRERLYRRVFNGMPIRVISFDSTGTQLRLLERDAIVGDIISSIQSAYPNGVDVKNGCALVERFSRYAILSHTWIQGVPGEVVYQDWETRELPIYSQGHAKIAKFCEVAAREHGVTFGWMDTACINKNSSTELDESIRSMYKWYAGAHVCVTYLAETTRIKDMQHDRWFTRGWTLQELLAPQDIRFYNKYWTPLVAQHSATTSAVDDPDFNRNFESPAPDVSTIPLELQYQIFKATSITRAELFMFNSHTTRVLVLWSRILQLAASRKVTREEDSIYSLMGLLDVGIPVAYGEGSDSALRRIIREIMASKPDFMDLFHHNNNSSIIPSDIADYEKRTSVFDTIIGSQLDLLCQPEPVVLTHMGIRLTLLAMPAFLKDIYVDHIPSTIQTHTFSLAMESGYERDYIILDDSNCATDWITNLVTLDDYLDEGEPDIYNQGEEDLDDDDMDDDSSMVEGLDDYHPSLVFLALLSSTVKLDEDGQYSLLASDALCIALKPNRVGGYKLVDIEPSSDQISGPITLPLLFTPPTRGGDILSITPARAAKLGFKVVTRYFT